MGPPQSLERSYQNASTTATDSPIALCASLAALQEGRQPELEIRLFLHFRHEPNKIAPLHWPRHFLNQAFLFTSTARLPKHDKQAGPLHRPVADKLLTAHD